MIPAMLPHGTGESGGALATSSPPSLRPTTLERNKPPGDCEPGCTGLRRASGERAAASPLVARGRRSCRSPLSSAAACDRSAPSGPGGWSAASAACCTGTAASPCTGAGDAGLGVREDTEPGVVAGTGGLKDVSGARGGGARDSGGRLGAGRRGSVAEGSAGSLARAGLSGRRRLVGRDQRAGAELSGGGAGQAGVQAGRFAQEAPGRVEDAVGLPLGGLARVARAGGGVLTVAPDDEHGTVGKHACRVKVSPHRQAACAHECGIHHQRIRPSLPPRHHLASTPPGRHHLPLPRGRRVVVVGTPFHVQFYRQFLSSRMQRQRSSHPQPRVALRIEELHHVVDRRGSIRWPAGTLQDHEAHSLVSPSWQTPLSRGPGLRS
jgi:hypothetical protein